MKQTTKTTFTEDETKMLTELLKNPLPNYPCDDCTLIACLEHCTKRRKYYDEIRPYEDAGLYDVARQISNRYHLMEEIKQLIQEYNTVNANLPTFLREPDIEIYGETI